MRYQAFVRAAATVLSTALVAGTAFAQAQPRTMTDTAPLPAADRSSVGAVILMDEPVIAQREALLQAQDRTGVDTRSMGAGPARLLRGNAAKQDVQQQRAEDAAKKRTVTPK
ncbi:MAG TPA: hypothetical protein VNB23_04315 [Ramlibacter sp.]|nr:hypothetical protein [Ramlibacter sp.]